MYADAKTIADSIEANVTGSSAKAISGDWTMEREARFLPGFQIASVVRTYERINDNCKRGIYTRITTYDCYNEFRHNFSTSEADEISENIVHHLRQMLSGQTFDFERFRVTDFDIFRMPFPPLDDVIFYNFKLITEKYKVTH